MNINDTYKYSDSETNITLHKLVKVYQFFLLLIHLDVLRFAYVGFLFGHPDSHEYCGEDGPSRPQTIEHREGRL